VIGRAELSCRELVELVSDYLDDSLDRRTRRRVARHLTGCEDCSEYVAQMRVTVRLLGLLDRRRTARET
jgi:anti-sigma factor RsiW